MRKRIILIIGLFLFFITRCKENYFNFINVIDGEVVVSFDTTKINLKDYIDTSYQYKVTFNNQEYNSSDDLIFDLNQGENLFRINAGKNTYTLIVKRKAMFEVKFIDNQNNVIGIIEKEENSIFEKADLEKITLNKPGYEIKCFSKEIPFEITSNMTIEVTYEPKSYQISFIINDEKLSSSIKTDEVINFPEVKPIDGYTFDGWYVGENKVDDDTLYKEAIGDTFTAKFIPNTYQVKFIHFDKEETKEIKTDEEINLPDVETIKGYTFLGWYAGDIKLEEHTKYSHNLGLIIEAKYVANTYQVTYQYFDSIYKENITYGSYLKLYIPTVTGYDFVCWMYNDQEFKEQTYLIDSNITLVGVFKKKEKIALNLETFLGEVDNLIDKEDREVSLPIPKKEGYKFKGWYKDIFYTTKVETINPTTYDNSILYAYYELDDASLKDQIIITSLNKVSSDYNDVVLYQKGVNISASTYWHKILLKEQDGYYYISAIGISGSKLSNLGDYDYVILVYQTSPLYEKIVSGDYSVGDKIKFIVDINEMNNVNIASIIKVDLSSEQEEAKSFLINKYSSIVNVDKDLELVESYKALTITWSSSLPNVISIKGIFHKPNVNVIVTLCAYINNVEIYKFSVNVEGSSSSISALSTGYIYTPYTITQNAMNKLDIIYCAFLEINDNADFTNLSSFLNKVNNNIIPKAINSGTKIVISINKGTSSSFSTVSASSTLRNKLAVNLLKLLKEYNFDGIDIDWETPSTAEKTNFTLLMKELYNVIKASNSNYLITAAIGGGMWQPPKYDLVNSKDYLDYINLMTYSMATGSGYYQNALYPSTKGATLTSCSIDESVKLYNSYGIRNEKILVGIPFYCTLQTNSKGPGSKTGQGKSIWYNVMLNNYQLSNTMKEYFDEECCVPYRYDKENSIFISYDNERSIMLKCQYIKVNNLAGIMYWQYGQDVSDMLTDAIYKYIK